ncbi:MULTISPECIES: hypothetical protein [Streptomyces]|uniref:Integral membrane protein n=1 Tax=Streptomyces lycii TaxID=2654337 RepID=A0ABQ7FMK1_9ACTN|nr:MULTISPECIES: hypothetical protein [Streptomyces]KAF4408442.1 hypothetical protein GCU69_14215 [Streptomyces lycii]PGH50040.1 hypothetical protein CRI70_14285 [Streptomyces sp. Ru87]
MGRDATALARVAVMVRVPATWLWWTGLATAAIGAAVPGSLLGRRVGVTAGAALLLVAAVVAFAVRRKRYRELAKGASRAGRRVFLQDRAVTARAWRRSRRWWLLLAALAALGSSFAAPAAGGLLMAGVGAGLWAKAVWLGRWERSHEALLWLRPEWAGRGPAGKDARGYRTTGPAAGDALPGGAKKRTHASGGVKRSPATV